MVDVHIVFTLCVCKFEFVCLVVCFQSHVQPVTVLLGRISKLFGTNDHDKMMCLVQEPCHMCKDQGYWACELCA